MPAFPGVLSGGEVFAAAMKLTDPGADVELLVADGEAFTAGTAAGPGAAGTPAPCCSPNAWG